MKKIFLFMIIALAACSCDKWLEATSSTQFKAEEIFSSREGFFDALSGVYINMGKENNYASNTTWKHIDILCYPYNSFTSLTLSQVQNHEFNTSNVKKLSSQIWLAYYNTIANINMALENIDGKESLFMNKSEYNWVKGELLALRAFNHLDLIRFFGSPGMTGSNGAKLAVPYVTTYSPIVTPQQSSEKTMELLLKDALEAAELLADDPVTGMVSENFSTTLNATGYWNNRKSHVNLYAVYGLLARIYQWDDDIETAAYYAKLAADGAMKSKAVSWIDPSHMISQGFGHNLANADLTFSCEHLFTLEINELYSIVSKFLIPSATGAATEAMYFSKEIVEYKLFPILETSGLEDVRGTAFYLEYQNGSYVCRKLFSLSNSKYRNLMPMIRLSEMYYIMAENEARNGSKAKAMELINEVRSHRGITEDIPSGYDALTELNLEYAREFLNEGQFLYWTKHDRLEHIRDIYSAFVLDRFYILPNPETMGELTLPYPDDEINYGRKQEL